MKRHRQRLPSSGRLTGVSFTALLLVGSLVAREFKLPEPGYPWAFPRDHANHAEYGVEWWYFTGHLLPTGADPDDDAWIHLELTFFRTSLKGTNSGELYFSHFAISGPSQPFRYSEAIARGTLGEAGAEEDVLHVWIDTWQVSLIDSVFVLLANDPEVGGIRLIATAQCEPVLHGERGFSPKGEGNSEASNYYSIPRMSVTGLYLPPEGAENRSAVPVQGRLWMDHEFGNQQLGTGLVGWDWWGLELPGGDALMFYLIRDREGNPIPQSEGTWMPKDGPASRVSLDDVTITPLETWTSPHSGATYPHGWHMVIPTLNLDLTIEPVMQDQELRTDRSTRVTYYEGAVRVTRVGYTGSSHGFVELVGYDQ